MIYHDVEQNSEEWNALRLGKFTASSANDLFMAPTTKGFKDTIIRVAYERITGESEERYSNKWMERGHEKEQAAADHYEMQTFTTLEKVGFYEYSDWIGASPDRKIKGVNAGCEFKCRSFQVYDEYMETKRVAKDVYWQIVFQLLCTGWDYIDYMPYNSPKLKTHIVRISAAEESAAIEALKDNLERCIELVKLKIERIKP